MQYQNVLITGCNRGLGLELVNQLAPVSKKVYACCRSPQAATQLSQLASELGNVELLTLDVTSQSQINSLHVSLKDEPLDLLINNAGVGNWERYPLPVEQWDQVMRINTIAPLKIAESLLEKIAASQRRLVVSISSKMGSIADNTSGAGIIYRSSKAGLNAAMHSFALDHAEQGIVTLLLHPGWVRTDMGGPNGLIEVTESVAGMLSVINKAGPSSNGCFLDYAGEMIAW